MPRKQSTKRWRHSKEYNAWLAMKQRCYNPKCASYRNYGGRGISVCSRWLTSFADFLEDMGQSPSPTHSVDRIDNNGPYSPDNCRWATINEQSLNRRTNRLLSHNGTTRTLTEWAKLSGINVDTLHWRLKKGILLAEAMTTPLMTKAEASQLGAQASKISRAARLA